MFTEGALLLERARRARCPAVRPAPDLDDAVKAVRDTTRPEPVRYAAAVSPAVDALLRRAPAARPGHHRGPLPVLRRPRPARSSAPGTSSSRAPRAPYVDQATGKVVSGTFRTAAERLDAVAAMGFDIIYLPPIHPIGRVNRKGRNNTLDPGPDDVGSPWAIGSDEGGHDAIHPDLGDHRGLRRFVARATELGLEVALDLALQAAPDHPWVKPAPRVVHHPRRRHDRLRREPAEEVPGHLPDQLRQRPRRASTPRCCGSCGSGWPTASGSSASTTRTPSRWSSGSGCSARSARPTPTCSSSPRRSPSPP